MVQIDLYFPTAFKQKQAQCSILSLKQILHAKALKMVYV